MSGHYSQCLRKISPENDEAPVPRLKRHQGFVQLPQEIVCPLALSDFFAVRPVALNQQFF